MLRAVIASPAGLPRSVHRLAAAYQSATLARLDVAASRFMSKGVAVYPYKIRGGTTALAAIDAKLEAAIPDRIQRGDVKSFVTVLARKATCARWDVTWKSGPRWPARVQSADLALQCAMFAVLLREAGTPVDDDVLQWMAGRWLAAGLPFWAEELR